MLTKILPEIGEKVKIPVSNPKKYSIAKNNNIYLVKTKKLLVSAWTNLKVILK